MDTVEAHAALQPPAAPMGRKPVSLPPEEADQLRAAGWTEAQIAAGKRQVAQPCRRCGGSGHLPGFRHVDGGRCFRCHAAGVDPKPTMEYAPSVRSKLDERATRRRNAKEAKRHAAFDGWLAKRPELAAALERAEADIRAWKAWDGCRETPNGGTNAKPHAPIAWNPFLAELTRQLRRREPLSDRQADFYVRRVAEISRQDEREREARRVPAPEGTVTFTGRVATIRSQPGYRGRAELKDARDRRGRGRRRRVSGVVHRPAPRSVVRRGGPPHPHRRAAPLRAGSELRIRQASTPGCAGRRSPIAAEVTRTADKRRRRRRGVLPAPAGRDSRVADRQAQVRGPQPRSSAGRLPTAEAATGVPTLMPSARPARTSPLRRRQRQARRGEERADLLPRQAGAKPDP